MSELLAPLDGNQQRLVDLIADAFVSCNYEWPVYDYIEGVFDHEGRDAWDVMQTFPEIGRWRYGLLWWVRGAPNMKPSAESEVALTIVGMSHTNSLREYVNVFFNLVDFLAERRRLARPEPRTPRSLTVTSTEFDEHSRNGRHLQIDPQLTWQLMEREPATYVGGGGRLADGTWTKSVARELLDYAGMTTVGEYVDRLAAHIVTPAPAIEPIVASPFSLAASLDYLDAVWQVTHDKRRLLHLASAERTTRLAFDVATADEFDGHMSALAEVLRAANSRATVDPERKHRDRTLARLEADIKRLAGREAVPRVEAAIAVLEAIIDVRDAGQHSGASERAVAGFLTLGVLYPPSDWQAAWQALSQQTVNSLNVLREALQVAALEDNHGSGPELGSE